MFAAADCLLSGKEAGNQNTLDRHRCEHPTLVRMNLYTLPTPQPCLSRLNKVLDCFTQSWDPGQSFLVSRLQLSPIRTRM